MTMTQFKPRNRAEFAASRLTIRVQCVVFSIDFEKSPPGLEVLVLRDETSERARWFLPSGAVGVGESLEKVAARILRERAGLRDLHLEQLYTFDPDKDGIVRVAYLALASRGDKDPAVGSEWHRGSEGMRARDASVLDRAALRLRAKIRYEPIGFSMLPEQFTMPQLRNLYEAVLGKSLDDRNFAKRMLSMGILRRVGESERGPGDQGRPATVYEFDAVRYGALKKKGWSFEI
jgi:8-oxo-dGTP diphosphatase